MPVRLPKPSPALQRARAAMATYRAEREALRSSSITRGLLLVVATIFLFSVWRAGLERAFVPRWWRLW